jgi:hypothetical protein
MIATVNAMLFATLELQTGKVSGAPFAPPHRSKHVKCNA